MGLQISPLGFRMPDGDEKVRQGDNVISANASLADSLLGQAFSDLSTVQAQIDNSPASEYTTEDLLAQIFANTLSPAVKALTTNQARPVGKGELVVNVADYGAKLDGTDSLDAFTAALAAAPRVYVPEGVYYVRAAVQVPSYTEIFGDGMGSTVIRLTADAGHSEWVLTNSDRTAGNTNIFVHDLSLDWDYDRTAGAYVGGGGSRGSCLTFGNVKDSRVERVEAINAALHGFDVCQSALDYPYAGDGAPAPAGPSSRVYLDGCVARNWGDDGFTTHHSEYLFISNCYAEFPRKRGNNNGFEVDDGSRHVFLTNNFSYKCSGGVEVKAHETASAAMDVHISGHLSVEDNKSYKFRHIGHDGGTDPVSLTAFDITATNLVSWHPNNRAAFYSASGPARALNIESYRNVSVTNFTAVADPTWDYVGGAVYVGGGAYNVSLDGINMRGFSTADSDILVGDTDAVSIDGVNILDGSPIGIDTVRDRVQVGSVVYSGPGVPIEAKGRPFVSVAAYRLGVYTLTAADTTTLSTVREPGLYDIGFTDYSQMTDIPPASSGGFLMDVRATGGTRGFAIQRLTKDNSGGAAPEEYYRVVRDTVGAWATVAVT